MPKKRKPLKRPRNQAFQRQNGRCFYCHQPMWQENPEQYAEQYGLTLQQAELMRCTGEHLIAHKDGGSASSDNIVAACFYCNQKRHKRKVELSLDKFKALVTTRVQKKCWHGVSVR